MSDSEDFGKELVEFLGSIDDEVKMDTEPDAAQSPSSQSQAQAPVENITGFKISSHGGFIYEGMLDAGFMNYTNNKKTFIVKVRSEFGGTVLTRQCSTKFETTCKGNVCTLGDTANYTNYLQIICGTDNKGNIGLFSTIPYDSKGQICTNSTEVPDLELSSDIKNAFYYGYLIYYGDDNGTTDKERKIHNFDVSPTLLSSEILKFYNMVKDSDTDTFNVNVSACLVLADKNLEISCMQKYKGIKADDEITFAGWFNCFENFVKYKCDQYVISNFLDDKIKSVEDIDKYHKMGLLTDDEYVDYQLKFGRRSYDDQRPSSRRKIGSGKKKKKNQTKKRKPFKKKKKQQTKKKKKQKKKQSKSKSK